MIEDGDFVILKKESSMRVVQAKKNGRPFIFERTKFRLDNIFGKPYGTQFEIDKKSSQLVLREDDFSITDALPETSSGLDNRNLVSANEENQNLGKDEIHALRNDGLTGDEVMTELIKNSATFTQKTKFSQEKWIKKKKKRHMNVYTVLRPSVRLVADMHYQKDPAKICFLRMDTLAQVLTIGNVQSTSKVLLVEACQGLLAGAILDRLNDKGCLTQFFTGPNPMKGRAAFDDFGFPKQLARSRMKLYPLNQLHELSMFAKSKETTTLCVPDEKRRRLNGSESCEASSEQSTGSSRSTETDSSIVAGSSPVTVKTLPKVPGVPVATSPVAHPPVTDPPLTDPPVADSLVADLPLADPPVADPPVAEPPVADPPLADPPLADPPVVDPPVAEPQVAEPPVAEPPVADPPVADPPVTDLLATNPSVADSDKLFTQLECEKRLLPNNSADELQTGTLTNSGVTRGEKSGVTRGEKRQLNEDQKREMLPHLMERQQAKKYIEENMFDTLIIAIKAQPTQLTLRLINLVKLSRPFVVFHPHKEPLMELFVQLKERGGVVNLKFSETWFRAIQVLPERTHPMVNMSGSSGYLLTGTVVEKNN
ncbi:tRNA (adenine(58)-N(1))-methyltransferase non-catalytic subunit TRM6-like [Watersipora subatra]|uniref:tRNA (adenine(58)-N(1))-methyltransferase non-catalytic subunit TRM6-like n=1 Tax=Watersipora subatra TaxID=2589382 RepID=UPI00355C77A8